jgi:hypothetical protein
MRAGYNTASVGPRLNVGFLGVVYIIVGAIVAATHHYYANLHGVKPVVSAVLAIVLWPLLLLGINLHVH